MDSASPGAWGSTTYKKVGNGSRRPYLYVGNLSPLVSERILSDLFEQAGTVRSTRVVAPLLHSGEPGVGYGFVEYARLASAEMALRMFQGYDLFGRTLRINWAHQGADAGEPVAPVLPVPIPGRLPASTSVHDGTSHLSLSNSTSQTSSPPSRLYSVFVGDLAPEINDAALAQAFSIFPSMFDARVIWDLQSHRSRGYGFVRFDSESDAMISIATMSGQWLGSRAIRVNWASRRLETRPNFQDSDLPQGQSTSTGSSSSGRSPDELAMTPSMDITAVYVGNLPPNTFLLDIVPHFRAFGNVLSAQIFQDRHFAFVTLDTHEGAAQVISHYQSRPLVIHGRLVKVGWARFMRQTIGGDPGNKPLPSLSP